MSSALIPVWIIGGPFLSLLLLSFLYRGGSSAARDRSVHRDLPGQRHASGYTVTTSIDRDGHAQSDEGPRSAELQAIARLSGHVDPGAIAELSKHVSPGSISSLSGRKPPGAIAALSAPKPVGSIASLSNGWFFSAIFGLPLLTASQRPLESDETLLINDRESHGDVSRRD
jgi:hypothetical protein